MIRQILLCLPFMLMTSYIAGAQDHVFGLFKSTERRGDEYAERRRYTDAVKVYEEISSTNRTRSVDLKLARCYCYVKNFLACIRGYEVFVKKGGKLDQNDLRMLSDAEMQSEKYDQALLHLRELLRLNPDDAIVIQKIWRIENKIYLFEDSMHFAVKPLPVNTSFSEFGAIPFNNGLLYLSNRAKVDVVKKLDAQTNSPFYKLFYSPFLTDTAGVDEVRTLDEIASHVNDLRVPFHLGPLSIYDQGRHMIFASTGTGTDNERNLQLYFASYQGGRWLITGTFPHNHASYSFTDPSMNERGDVLYFASDKEGGYGGKDLYRSKLESGVWSVPENLGEQINTVHDESFPFVHPNGTLYFSSNGHAGLGGLDIFRISLLTTSSEVVNMGYPVNSFRDDFSIYIDSLERHGFLASNRVNGGYDDDLFEFDMDLQTYPIELSGLVWIKEHDLSDSTEIKSFPNARMFLIDNARQVSLSEVVSNEEGKFSIVIPYLSKYSIKVIGPSGDEHVVSLELPRHRKQFSTHDIVVVKDAFNTDKHNSTNTQSQRYDEQ